MKIVLDVSPLSRPRTGIGNYIRGMVAGLAEAAEGRHKLVAFGPSGPRGRARIRESLAGLPLELRLPLLPRAQLWRSGWSRLAWPAVESVVGRLDGRRGRWGCFGLLGGSLLGPAALLAS